MNSLLIGSSGFLGKRIAEKISFGDFASSESPIRDERFDLVVCSAPSARKWFANQNPNEDKRLVEELMHRVEHLRVGRFVLLSTIDVYADVSFANENSSTCSSANPYGFHRLGFENFVSNRFSNTVILRLSGLVGRGLVKNPIYDLKHHNNLSSLNPESQMQFLPVEVLVREVQNAIVNDDTGIFNLTAEPIKLFEAAELCNLTLELNPKATIVNYDVRTTKGSGGQTDSYTTSKIESLVAIQNYFEGNR